ncbi:phosphoinositide 3-kinase adapter protein 1 [Nothobranchius furzeri]|uniref:Phosphoinositide-3-kinase adaptor protein 1 n=2 Tax=Nothobranchius TaxID=28779 RepID=A0A1A7ZGV5_NOTFU|nr:phosphoinositide 3-kinase adapter protein 1 [Nothobranchius furzeri]KAF7219833.1 phosphoinositide-3-kinase adaptor protein 1 [Nothobranchius furzeri]
MEKLISSPESGASESYELLILHTDEAQEWATYLQQILKSSQKFNKESILLYTVSPADRLHGYNFDNFQSCSCIVLLLTGLFLDILFDRELHGALQELLRPPHKVVTLLCGVSEDDVSTGSFRDWPTWRKLYADDEPAVYISTILESITDSKRAASKSGRETSAKMGIKAAPSPENPTTDKNTEVASENPSLTILMEEKKSTSQENPSPSHQNCLTIQPSRVLCGEPETLFIIFSTKMHYGTAPEVEFSSENGASEKVPANVENEYTISVAAPDMPAGITSLTLYTDQSRVSLKTVTFHTSMGEVSRYLEKAVDPVDFICQAFDLSSNATESLDTLLTDSLKSKMPEIGLQLFGVHQIEEDNMSAYQRAEEFPTLLHFAARYGLRKLTLLLLQCPGALQAYSVSNKNGDYPNTLAEKSGFNHLRQLLDDFVETENILKPSCGDDTNLENDAEVYEPMSHTATDMKIPSCSEEIYESMVGIDPNCAEDLYEVMTAVDKNPEEALLRMFFQATPQTSEHKDNNLPLKHEEGKDERRDFDLIEEEEDPYNIFPEDIYDTVDGNSTYNPAILNRPPAPIPRPESESEPEPPTNYISRVFSDKGSSPSRQLEGEYSTAQLIGEPLPSTYDPYAGMKTPGQRQLICLQERVKVGEITVDEAVQEFKAWQFNHEGRASSFRYQQENIKKLRDSITRRHKEREKSGKEIEYEISAPLLRNSHFSSNMTVQCDVYEPTPRMMSQPPPTAQPIQRGSWKTGSTSSTSSTESNRLSIKSTHSTVSYSSGTEPEFEDAVEMLPPPPRPPRPSDPAPLIPPPRIPPRIPDRVPEKMHERYISCPTRPLPQKPPNRQTCSAPPIPRRLR